MEIDISYILGDIYGGCVTGPGAYNYLFARYTSKVATTDYSSGKGAITFTVFKNSYAEGYFNFTCKHNSDSVTIAGTFKGKIE